MKMRPLNIVLILSLCATLAVCAQDKSDDALLWQKAKAAVKAAIPLAEKDPYRPVFHYRPPAQSLSDICGAFYFKGWHHIFYQFHPFSAKPVKGAGWGHARSRDLVHWEVLPPALLPDKSNGSDRDASGSAFLSHSGDPMLFFTMTPSGYYDRGSKEKREQWAALPVDEDLIRWRRVPIGLAPGKNGVPKDIRRSWADMFVFQADDRVFGIFKECKGLVVEAQNPNLLEWKAVGNLDHVPGECPNMFALNGRYVLIMSMLPIQYRVGDFDADEITFKSKTRNRVLDYGPGPELKQNWNRGFYATTVFRDSRDRTVLLGWISGFKPDRGWSGCMGIPRILSLDKADNLIQTPLPELRKLRGNHRTFNRLALNNKEERLKGIEGDTMEILAEFEAGDATAFGLKVRQSQDGKNAVTIRYTNGKLNVAGTDVPLKLVSGQLKLHVFIDKSVLEVFINDGVTSVTRVEYPGENDLGVSVFAENGGAILKSLDAWEVKPIW